MNKSPGTITWAGLAVVAAAAAVLSFASLDGLAALCGTPARLSWLLPISIDAAAVVATRVWLRPGAPGRVRRFARTLAIAALGLSVMGNGMAHWLVAFHVAPPWWAVVAVAAVPPVVLGAVAHLAAIVVTQDGRQPSPDPTPALAPASPAPSPATPADHQPSPDPNLERVAELVASDPDVGRPTVARELNISEHQARKLLEQVRANGHQPVASAGGDR